MASPGLNYREHWWQEDGGLEGSFVACLASPFAGQWLNQGPDARPSGGAEVGVWSCCVGCVPMRGWYKAELHWDPIKYWGFSNRWEEDLIVLLFIGKLWLLFWSFSFSRSIKDVEKRPAGTTPGLIANMTFGLFPWNACVPFELYRSAGGWF